MSDKYFTMVKDGQQVVATLAQSGTIVPEEGKDPAKYYTALVQTADGLQQVVKTFDLNGGGGGGSVAETTWFDGATAVEGTDYTNEGCTFTEVPSSTHDYYYNPTTGVITFAEELVNGTVAVEHSL